MRLGDLDALKFEMSQQLAFQKEKAKLTTINADKMAHSLVATGLQLAIDIIDNAPAVENITVFAENADEKTIADLKEELQKVIAEKRPQGEWIIVDDTEQFIAKCSVCGRIEDSRMVKDYPFCHCGASMKGD